MPLSTAIKTSTHAIAFAGFQQALAQLSREFRNGRLLGFLQNRFGFCAGFKVAGDGLQCLHRGVIGFDQKFHAVNMPSANSESITKFP